MKQWNILTLALLLTIPAAAIAQDNADALAQRFLAHMEANAPIAGEFELVKEYDPERYQRLTTRLKERSGDGAIIPPRISREITRWGWDGVREMCEGPSVTFFNSPEGQLFRREEGLFHLMEPDRVSDYRPGSFYSLNANGLSWSREFRDKTFDLEPASPEDPQGTVWLLAKREEKEQELRLLIERDTGVLHRVLGYYQSHKFLELRITAFQLGEGGRRFPREGWIGTFNRDTPDRPKYRISLTAKKITFPDTRQQTDRAMTLPIPKGTTISDRMLNRGIELTATTEARQLVEGVDPSKSRTLPVIEPPVLYTPGTQETNWWWVAGGVGVFALAATVIVIRRTRRV